MWGARLKYAMVAPIIASRNDWTPNARMVVTSHRCATIRICSTRTAAAISVIMRLPNSGSFQKYVIVSSKQERRHQGQARQHECHSQQLRNPEQTQLGVGRFHQ